MYPRKWLGCCPEGPDFCTFWVDGRHDWNKDSAHWLQRHYLWFRKAWMLKRTQNLVSTGGEIQVLPAFLYPAKIWGISTANVYISGITMRIKSRGCWYRLPETTLTSCKLSLFSLIPNANMQSGTTGISLLGEAPSSNPTGSRPSSGTNVGFFQWFQQSQGCQTSHILSLGRGDGIRLLN